MGHNYGIFISGFLCSHCVPKVTQRLPAGGVDEGARRGQGRCRWAHGCECLHCERKKGCRHCSRWDLAEGKTCLGKKRWEEQCYGGEGALGCLELRPDSSSQVWAQCLPDCLPTEPTASLFTPVLVPSQPPAQLPAPLGARTALGAPVTARPSTPQTTAASLLSLSFYFHCHKVPGFCFVLLLNCFICLVCS